MTDLGSSRPDVDTSRVAYGNSPDPTGWTGWVVFASFMMIMLGSFQAIEGLVAIFKDDFYHVRPVRPGRQRRLQRLGLDPPAPGRRDRPRRRRRSSPATSWPAPSASSSPALSAMVNLLFIEAYPIWSIIIITVDVLVIYALTVHGRELRDSDV